MLIPWNTDAPIYHFPFVTIALIVVNTAAFFAALQSDEPERWMLAFGDGLHPVQWVSSAFMHADIVHLLGNMIFLWGFGLVIEGKLGWWRFALIYLGLATIQSAIVQACMQHQPGYALGASGAIYGLLAMSLIWAPRNEIHCVGIYGFRIMHLDIPILAFVSLYVGWEVVIAWLGDFAISSAMLHLAGALPGFALGILLLKLGAVDCENWDIFAVIGGREGRAKARKADPKKVAAKRRHLADAREAAAREFDQLLAQGRVVEALALDRRMKQSHKDWQLTQQQRLALVKNLHRQQLWSQSVQPMADYLRAAPDSAPRVRLSLAKILLLHEKRPGLALSVLEKIAVAELTDELRGNYEQLMRRAKEAYADGDLEPEQEGW